MTDVLALNRFGMGASPRDSARVGGLPQTWQNKLLAQLTAYQPRPALLAQSPGFKEYAGLLSEHLDPAMLGKPSVFMPPYIIGQTTWKAVETLVPRDVNARIEVAMTTKESFPERLVHFWQNHFAVSSTGGEVMGFSPSFEFDAIRPNIMGKFKDMVLAVLRHAAMQWYLGNVDSYGPYSVAGYNGLAPSGVNENLGRELLELHTLGVDGGYTQQDVIQMALALTGWSTSSVSPINPFYGTTLKTTPGAFIFQPDRHEPGPRTILGKVYPQTGEDQVVAIVTDLCMMPACADFIARKISRHFLREDGNDALLVGALKTAYLGSGGDLATVYRALIANFRAADVRPKIKSANEWVISMGRAIGGQPPTAWLAEAVENCKQITWSPGSPAGWPDKSSFWLSSGAMVERANAAFRLMVKWGALPTLDAVVTASKVAFSAQTLATARAQSLQQAQLAVLFCSPEFMRR